jgi:hypothetical protein
MKTHPIANVRQSDDGANAVTATWSIVLAETCSDVEGSNMTIRPFVVPSNSQSLSWQARFKNLPKAILPFFIHAAAVK